MTGGFVFIVGPSGAGKDTLIGLAKGALAQDERFIFPRRLVTRPKSAWEDHDTIDPDAFERAEAAGRFCLSWRAHGLCYGISAEVFDAMRRGRVAVCNVSRRVVEDARRRLHPVSVVEITAPIDILARRLAARARPDDGEIDERILRSRAVGDMRADLTIVNDSAPEEGAAALIAYLRGQVGAGEYRERAEASASR